MSPAERERLIALLEELGQLCFAAALSKGFYDVDGAPSFGEAVAEIHEEASEALRAWRDGETQICYREDAQGRLKPEGAAVEIADVLIRTLSLGKREQLPVAQAFAEKMDYNRTRPYRHGRV